jgi:tRNA 2-thiouridine synthesizing protein A
MADRELDIRGEVCPFTFVKSKLVLEQMELGQVLRVVLDYPPSVENVPKSMREEGQEVHHKTRDRRAQEIGCKALVLCPLCPPEGHKGDPSLL